MSDLRAHTADWFSVDEIARAAGVPAEQAWRSIGQGQALVQDRHVPAADAVHLVRVLRGLEAPSRDRFPFNDVPMPRQKEMTRGVVLAGAVHVIAAILIFSPALIRPPVEDGQRDQVAGTGSEAGVPDAAWQRRWRRWWRTARENAASAGKTQSTGAAAEASRRVRCRPRARRPRRLSQRPNRQSPKCASSRRRSRHPRRRRHRRHRPCRRR